MKEQRGITLESLTIYIIALLIIIGLVSTVTTFFYSNILNISDNSKNMAEITKFNMYFLKDIKKSNNTVTAVVSDNSQITFSSGNVYKFQNNAIYQNKIKICDNVSNAQFKLEKINNKDVVSVLLSIGEQMEVTKTVKYVLSGI